MLKKETQNSVQIKTFILSNKCKFGGSVTTCQ